MNALATQTTSQQSAPKTPQQAQAPRSGLQTQLKAANYAQGQAMLAAGLAEDEPRPIAKDIESQLEAAIMVAIGGAKVSKYFAVSSYDEHIANVAKAVDGESLNSLSTALNGGATRETNLQKDAIGGESAAAKWPQAYADALSAIYAKLAEPARSRFVCAVLKTANQADDALAASWTPTLDFAQIDGAELVDIFELLASQKLVPLWDRLALTGSPMGVASVSAAKWPIEKRATLLARIGEDESALGTLLEKSSDTVASWLTPEVLSADKALAGLASALVNRRHPAGKRPLLEACLQDARLVDAVATWDLSQLKWLVDRGRPLGPNVAAVFERKKTSVWSDPVGLEQLMELRFGFEIKDKGQAFDDANQGAKAEAFSLGGLQQAWTALAAPPGADVEVTDFSSLVRVAHKSGNGIFGGYGGGTMQLGYLDPSKEGKGLSLMLSDSQVLGANTALPDVNSYDHTVRHELGHAMERTYTIMDKFGAEPEFGGWQVHGKDVDPLLGGALASFEVDARRATAEGKAQGKTVDNKPILAARDNESKTYDPYRPDKEDETRDKSTGQQNHTRSTEKPAAKTTVSSKDPAKLALTKKLGEVGPSAWPEVKKAAPELATTRAGQWLEKLSGATHYSIEDPVQLGGRVYVYENGGGVQGWASYLAGARKKKVSNFQFKSPREWFAEVYAAYYNDMKEPGKSLGSVDAASKRFIDEMRSRMSKDPLAFQDREESKDGTRNLNAAREAAKDSPPKK